MSDRRFCGNVDVLMSYLYEEDDSLERQAFETHLAGCEACAGEVSAMRAVRGGLAAWAPPETVLDFRIVREPESRPRRFAWVSIPQMPAWAQFAAASLVVGVAVGISGLEVRYDQQGWTVRAGWSKQVSAQTAVAAPSGVQQASTATDAPWRAELAAFEQKLRTERRPADAGGSDPGVRQASNAGPRQPMSDQAFMARVRELIDASETRQQREMAVRISQVMRDFDTQRRTDLTRVVNGMGALEGRTGAAVAEQRELLNYLVRVSQKQQ
ncbi:MAG: zf-HC2 domain-containing protein [Acidobacteria bacterium]|nr:zf-HC2 domain-containing protein [Acidobacteriota bacterium]